MKKTVLFLIFAITLTAGLLACNTLKDIPEDMTASQLLQQGQTCLDNSDYKNAEAYYLATINRYGQDTNT